MGADAAAQGAVTPHGVGAAARGLAQPRRGWCHGAGADAAVQGLTPR